MGRRSTFGTVIFVLAGPIAWALHVTVIYGMQSTACSVGESPELLVDAVISLATGLAAVIVAVAAVKADRLAAMLGAGDWPGPTQAFNRHVMVLLAILSLFAIVGAGAAAAFLPACDALR